MLKDNILRLCHNLAAVVFFSSFLYAAPSQVTVSGRRLLVNGQTFTVQGVAYSPTPVGSTLGNPSSVCVGPYSWWADRPAYSADFPLIKKMGANTLRAYAILNDTSTTNVLQVRAALDAAQAQGLYVIMNYFPDHHLLPSDAANQALWQTGFLAAVDAYKDHPAVLLWEFGNEQNLDNGKYIGWYPFVNKVLGLARQADPNHPFMTVEGECPTCPTPTPFTIGVLPLHSADDPNMTNLDIWGVNVYRGRTFQGLFQTLAASTGKPVLVTEFGKDAYHDAIGGEDQEMQAGHLTSQAGEIAANLSATGAGSKDIIGGVVFEWTDEWWKDTNDDCLTHGTETLFTIPADTADPNYQNEWFGLAAVAPVNAISNPGGTQRTLRKSYAAMQALWNPSAVQSPVSADSFFSDTVRNYPNPFQLGPGSTKFVVLTNEAGTVDIRIFDAGGQFVTSFSQTVVGPGRMEIVWDGHNGQGSVVSSGLYVAKIHGKSSSHEETQFRRVVGVK